MRVSVCVCVCVCVCKHQRSRNFEYDKNKKNRNDFISGTQVFGKDTRQAIMKGDKKIRLTTTCR